MGYQNIVADMYSKVIALESSTTNIRDEISAFRSDVTQNNLTVFERFEQVDSRFEELAIPKIAFMVKGLETWSGYRRGDVVPFNDIVLNAGGHFSRTTHSFVCPIDGLYVFSVSFTTRTGYINYLRLRKNSAEVSDIYAYDDDSSNSRGTGSVSIVLECSKYDDVRVVTGVSGNMYAVRNIVHMFSGFLLNKL